jgi:hypothetical protein
MQRKNRKGRQAQHITSSDNLKELQESVKEVIFWKYFSIILAIILLILYTSYDASKRTFDFSAIVSNALLSVLVSLILALFYDVFIRKQQQLTSRIEKIELSLATSKNIFSAYAVDSMTSEDMKKFVKGASERNDFLLSVAGLLTDDDKESAIITQSFLHPFTEKPSFSGLRVTNRLLPDPNNSDNYIWNCRKRFRFTNQKSVFRCILTKNNDIANCIVSSKLRCHSLILLSEFVDYDIKDFFDHVAQFKAEKVVSGNRVVLNVTKKDLDISYVRDCLQNPLLSADDIAVIDYCVNDVDKDTECSFSFTQSLCLKDPYFYWASDNYFLSEEISVDYSGIKSLIGRVSALTFIGNLLTSFEHDQLRGEVNIRVKGLLTPGEGVLIVWRGK